MRKKLPIIRLSLIQLLVLLASLACVLSELTKCEDETNSDITHDYYSFSGTGTTTWNWNHGEALCDTQDQVTLTITDYDVVLESVGICPSPKYSFDPYKFLGYCYETTPGQKCGNKFTGDFNPDYNTVNFTDCTAGKAKGYAVLKVGHLMGEVTNIIGQATCLPDDPEPSILKFTLTAPPK